jgi:hypothetical protein
MFTVAVRIRSTFGQRRAHPTKLENTIVTLSKMELEHLDNDRTLVRLEPLQQMNLHFEKGRAVIDDIPLMLPEDTPYYSLAQHLVMARLEYVLAEMDIFYFRISAKITEEFAALLQLRGYQYSQEMYNKYLLMTNTVNVLL